MRYLLLLLFTLGPLQAEVSLEDKIAQLLIVHFNGVTINDEARELVQELKVGGIIYYNWSNGLRSPEQVLNLSEGLQKLAAANNALPLLIAVDQEGGRVTRLKNGFSEFPGNAVLGQTDDIALTEAQGYIIGKELMAVGVNMNLAPVVDVNSNPKNPVIGTRAFSDDPDIVVRHARAFIQGLSKGGVIATLKHFPGHGDTLIDSHYDLPTINKSIKDLEAIELKPFQELIDTDVIMTAHILVPTLDPIYCSTLSAATLDYLRNHMGFQGVIITDSLVMMAILKKQSIEEACLRALQAGCTLLLLGGKDLSTGDKLLELSVQDIKKIHTFLLTQVKAGVLSEKIIDTAFERVVKLKHRRLSKEVHP